MAREVAETLRVAPRAWPIQHVGMARPAGGPTPEYQRLREGELRLIGAARAQRSPSLGWAQRFIWPARGRVSGPFGSQRIYRGGVPAAYHSGADLAAGAGAPRGGAGRRHRHARAAAALQPRGQSRHPRSRHGADQRLPASVERRGAARAGRPAGRADRHGRRDRPRDRAAPPLEPGLERRPDRSRGGGGALCIAFSGTIRPHQSETSDVTI